MRGLLIVLLATTAAAQPVGGPGKAPAVEAPTVVLEDPRLPWRMSSLACLGGGVVALALGAVAYGKGTDYESQVVDAEKNAAGAITGVTQREALRLQEAASDSKGLGAVGFAAGGLLITAGVVLYLLEPPPALVAPSAPEPEVRPFSLVPTFGPDGAGLSALATF